MRINNESMNNNIRFGRLNIGINAPKGFNKVSDKDQYSMQFIFKDTSQEQDAVYINGKKLGRLSSLRGADTQARAGYVLGRLGNNEIKLSTKEADPAASFKTSFNGLWGLVKGAFKTSPAMSVEDVWNGRKSEIQRRAYLASMADSMNFPRVADEKGVSYDPLTQFQMRRQGEQILDRYRNGKFVVIV